MSGVRAGVGDWLLEGRKEKESEPPLPRSLGFQRSPPGSTRGAQGPEGGRAGSGWGRAVCLWGRRASTEGAQPARGLAGPLERRRGKSAGQCAPRCVRLWLGARCITPFIALGLAARPSPGYQSQADVMLLIASPENQPN